MVEQLIRNIRKRAFYAKVYYQQGQMNLSLAGKSWRRLMFGDEHPIPMTWQFHHNVLFETILSEPTFEHYYF